MKYAAITQIGAPDTSIHHQNWITLVLRHLEFGFNKEVEQNSIIAVPRWGGKTILYHYCFMFL